LVDNVTLYICSALRFTKRLNNILRSYLTNVSSLNLAFPDDICFSITRVLVA